MVLQKIPISLPILEKTELILEFKPYNSKTIPSQLNLGSIFGIMRRTADSLALTYLTLHPYRSRTHV